MATSSTPLVSIIIPCYVATTRQAELLDITLDTVSAQTYRNYEVIVVDDGSPMDVAATVRRHPQARTLRRPNGGSAQARNTALPESRGEYFVFLDADDFLLPPALEAGLHHLAEHPECGFAVGRREEMTFEGELTSGGIAPMPQVTQLYETLLGYDWYIIPPSAVMFQGEVVKAVGGFRDPWGADDLDYYLRVARQYPGWCYEEPAVTRYRRYRASSSRDGERMLKSLHEVYARQWEFAVGNPVLEAAWTRGRARLSKVFVECLAENLHDRSRAREWSRAFRVARLLARENPRRLLAEIAGNLSGAGTRK